MCILCRMLESCHSASADVTNAVYNEEVESHLQFLMLPLVGVVRAGSEEAKFWRFLLILASVFLSFFSRSLPFLCFSLAIPLASLSLFPSLLFNSLAVVASPLLFFSFFSFHFFFYHSLHYPVSNSSFCPFPVFLSVSLGSCLLLCICQHPSFCLSSLSSPVSRCFMLSHNVVLLQSCRFETRMRTFHFASGPAQINWSRVCSHRSSCPRKPRTDATIDFGNNAGDWCQRRK